MLVSGGGVAGNGGGVAAVYRSEVALRDVTMEQNSATESGGAIVGLDSSFTLEHVEAANNEAAEDGGLMFAEGGTSEEETLKARADMG